jgi:FK506-binding nuclear protein
VNEPKEEKKEEKKEKKKEKKEKKKEGRAAGDVKELEGGVAIKDIKVGDGPGAQKGQPVKMRYIGKLTDGKVFDSNTKGKPVSPS